MQLQVLSRVSRIDNFLCGGVSQLRKIADQACLFNRALGKLMCVQDLENIAAALRRPLCNQLT
ncbi:hypothetical protein D3C77_681360 [compost metagenome]